VYISLRLRIYFSTIVSFCVIMCYVPNDTSEHTRTNSWQRNGTRKLTGSGQARADVWCGAVIDGFPAVAEWRWRVVLPDVECPSQEWLAAHVRASQYFPQAVKCDNEECCAPFRSSLKSVLLANRLRCLSATDCQHGPSGYAGVDKFQIWREDEVDTSRFVLSSNHGW